MGDGTMPKEIRKQKTPRFEVTFQPVTLITTATQEWEPFYIRVRKEQSEYLFMNAEYREELLLMCQYLACGQLELVWTDGGYDVQILWTFTGATKEWFAHKLLLRKSTGHEISYSVLDFTADEFQKQ